MKRLILPAQSATPIQIIAALIFTATVALGQLTSIPGGSTPPSGAAAGDLSGTYPNPTVAKLNGVAVSGTPSTGQVPTATSATAATWQTPNAGMFQYQTTDLVKTADTAFANAPGISYALAIGTTYRIQVNLYATSTGGTFKTQLAFSGTTSFVGISRICTNDGGTTFIANDTAFSTPRSVSGTGVNCMYTGAFTTTSPGTLTVQFAQNSAVGTSTLTAGNVVSVQPIN